MRKTVGTLAMLALVASTAQAQIAPSGVWNTMANPPGVTFGGTGINTPMMQRSLTGVDLYLAATPRGAGGNPAVTNNGAGTFYAQPGPDQSLTPVAGYAQWNWNFAVLGAGSENYKYALFYDLNSAMGTSQAGLYRTAFFNVANNSTAAQNSWNNGMGFLSTGTGFPAGWLAPTLPPTFNSNAGGEFTYVLAAYRLNGTDYSLASNNADLAGYVSMNVNVVPEPSTYLLMGAGLAGVLFAARRRRNRATIA